MKIIFVIFHNRWLYASMYEHKVQIIFSYVVVRLYIINTWVIGVCYTIHLVVLLKYTPFLPDFGCWSVKISISVERSIFEAVTVEKSLWIKMKSLHNSIVVFVILMAMLAGYVGVNNGFFCGFFHCLLYIIMIKIIIYVYFSIRYDHNRHYWTQ